MRAVAVVLCLAACGESGTGPAVYEGTGGTLAVPGCGYSVTTRFGADPPAVVGDEYVGSDPTPHVVHLGIVGDPRTSVVIQWRTVDETTRASTARFAVGSGLDASALTETAEGIEFGYKATGSTVYREHQVHLCGLQPGTSYSYQVGGAKHFSPVYTFHTAPDVTATPDAEVVLGFVGDSRGGYDIWQQLVGQLQARTPDLVLFSGDATTVSYVQSEWDDFFTRAEPLFATVPFVMAHGNHEANSISYFSQVAQPGDQLTFGFDYGHAHITVANDTPEDPAAIAGAIHDAIAADFTASDAARWKLFMHHQPMWSASARHGSNLEVRQAWQPLVDAHHIDLVLNGHEHDYEITKPLLGSDVQATSDTGTVYVIAGGAGADLYPNGTDVWTAYSEEGYAASTVRVTFTQLTLDAFHPDGSALPAAASFTKTKP